MKKITPFLWFKDNAEEAINFYTSIFKNSKVHQVSRYPDAGQETGKMQPETGGTAFLDGVSLSLGDQISSHSLFQCLIGSRLIGGFQIVYADSQRRSQVLVRNAGSNSNASALHHAEHPGGGNI